MRKILVVRQHDQLGDMLCAVPLLRALRTKYPGAGIFLVASPVNEEIMRHHEFLHTVYRYDKRVYLDGWRVDLAAAWRFLQSIRKARFDVAIVPVTVSVSLTSNLIAFFSGASTRIGPESLNGEKVSSGVLFNLPVNPDWRSDPHRHQTLRNLDCCKPLLLTPPPLEPVITLTKEEYENGRRWIAGERRSSRYLVAFHPGAGKPPNRWPAYRFAAVADRLAKEQNSAIFVTKGPMDEEPVGQMLSGLGSICTIIDRKPIREVAAILSQMDIMISNDTGIMHVAASVGVPVLSLFGPTDRLQWAPNGKLHRALSSGPDIRSISQDLVLRHATEMLEQGK